MKRSAGALLILLVLGLGLAFVGTSLISADAVASGSYHSGNSGNGN